MNDQAFTFQTLHPDTIMDALFEQGIRVDSGLTALNSYENRVYQFQDEERQRFVVKFYRPQRWSAEQIQEEHQFAHDLLDDDVPVAAPFKFNNQTLLTHQGFYYAVFPSLGGRQFEADNIDQMEWVARYLGRIHQTGRKKPFVARPTIGVQEYLIEPRQVFETSALIPNALKDNFLTATDKLIDAVKACWRDDITTLRLHGDCHAGNILWRDGPLFVDLDDARMGPAVQDLWMLLNGDKAEQRMQLETIIEAYEEFIPFNSDEIALIEPLRAMRFVYYLAWLIRRWEDPAFPRNFPWLTGEDYWRNQISTFTEQVKVLQEPPLQLTPMY
ncbi:MULTISPECIES: serine/threonine protein kinase [Enterobacter cloacae complex]|uniref:serine/threonine protein kinase n=1 Tax=Enterobacter cloacae complex TaxID=354276 RepID=UPI0007993D8F|nr:MULTISPECIES: serine/threonine protein kinase [Enterobacter cloacae complex]MBQ0463454.1 serine/threonine protein kinase [Enterobacter hormaechei]RYA92130.1 serine/threonine protein kinase [Enterobacter cloacae complex sp. 743-2DZ2F-22B]CZZ78631.1 aminoglycoside phosphotransferase [Enterobacter hormaechei]SAA33114.1 aminoglycoside phosphotransferase [Enterobacter hormaechei]SAB02274.1 aminoglycoside phosphotransferase [Enterobacter hormaechei]